MDNIERGRSGLEEAKKGEEHNAVGLNFNISNHKLSCSSCKFIHPFPGGASQS